MAGGANGKHANGKAAAAAPPEHPKDSWEMAYVWGFLTKFGQHVTSKTPGLDSVMDLEEAVLFPGATPVLESVLMALIRMCKPNTHSRLDTSSIHKHLSHLITEKINAKDHKMKLDCIWYNERTREFRNPLEGAEDVFKAPWMTKLEILRQLVDWALVTDPTVRDRARAPREALKYITKPKEPAETPELTETIAIEPLGLDLERRRYWIMDYSGRMYRSGNPWKNVCAFTTVTSSVQELQDEVTRLEAVLEQLDKDRAAKPRNHPLTKWENSMRAMVLRLRNDILPKVELEETRQTKKRKAMETRQNYIHLHELRETRTRRQTNKPRYVYDQVSEEEDNAADAADADDFIDDDGDNYLSDEEGEPDAKRARNTRAQAIPTRQSGRVAAANAAKQLEAKEANAKEWRGERRSSRFGGPSLDEPTPSVAGPSSPAENGTATATSVGRSSNQVSPALDDDEIGAQQIFDSVSKGKQASLDKLRNIGGVSRAKENEIVVEAPKGKRPGKFWFYAVEPVINPGSLEIPDPPDVRRRPRRSRNSLRVDSVEPSREPSEQAVPVKEEDHDVAATDDNTLTNGSGSRHGAPAPELASKDEDMDVED